MQIVNASKEVIEQIKEILNKNGSDERNLRIVGSLGFGDIPEGFKLFPAEITPKDQVQEIDGITFIVADILVKLYGSFTLTRNENPEYLDIKITPDKKPKNNVAGCSACSSCS